MHYHDPSKAAAFVAIFYRNFGAYGDYDYCGYEEGYEDNGGEENSGGGMKCHRGLGINALMTAKVLRKNGIHCALVPVNGVEDVRKYLTAHPGVTHAVFQALWVSSADMVKLCQDFDPTHFIVRCHSQIGFLQAEPNAIKTLRDLLFAQEMTLNLSVSSNTHRLQNFLQDSYKSKVLYLPNLYDLDRVKRKTDDSFDHRLLRIGSFGAHRLLKNHTTAAAAAMMMAQRHGSDLEFYVNAGRAEGTKGDQVLQSLKNMLSRVPWARLIEVPWEEWSEFRQTVGFMDLCLQVSFTETFNIVTADAVAEGVPSVVSDAIEWVPDSWKADVDDAADIARKGAWLLWDTHGAEEGLARLQRYCKEGVETWLGYLDSNPTI